MDIPDIKDRGTARAWFAPSDGPWAATSCPERTGPMADKSAKRMTRLAGAALMCFIRFN